MTVVAAGCFLAPYGYSPTNPTEVNCGCEDGQSCFQSAGELARSQGETAETGETIMYFTKCACFQGSVGGCNMLSHFAKDFVAWCEAGDNVRDSCAIAGYVHEHGTKVPMINGRSFDRDPAAAAKAFRKACDAGARMVCDRAGG